MKKNVEKIIQIAKESIILSHNFIHDIGHTVRVHDNVLKIALENIKSNYILNNPVIMYENKKQVVDNLLEKIKTLIYYKITNYNLKLDHLKNSYILNHPEELYKKKSLKLDKIITSLELLNPLSVLKRGYTLTYKNDKVVRNIKDLKVDDIITIKFKEGIVKANIKEIGE